MEAEPIGQRLVANYFEINAGISILEVFGILLLLSGQQVSLRYVGHWVLDLVSHDFYVLKQHHGLECTQF